MPEAIDNPRLILGLKLRALRAERGLTLQETAARAGLSISYLSEIEKGRKYPKPERLLGLAEAFGIPFDDLVSLQVDTELGPLKRALSSPFLREFPFRLFGFDREDLFALMNADPVRAGAFLKTFLEIARSYDLSVEQFLLAALRAYQEMHHNHFAELEEAAAAFREEAGLDKVPVDPVALRSRLEERHGYRVDVEALAREPALASLRSVFRQEPGPTLFVNGQLLPSQQAFVLAREIGYRRLDLESRAITSSWIQVESFDQVLNHFRASYFAGAVLLPRDPLVGDLAAFLATDRWSPAALVDLMERYDSTPETFFTRLTQLLPEELGLEEIFFLRFTARRGSDHLHLTKVLNLSQVPVPHGVGPAEHYCRRWPGTALLHPPLEGGASPSRPTVQAQRSFFLDQEEEFLVLATVRPLALQPDGSSSVSLGFRLDRRARRRIRFWDDPAIPRLDVGLTCERCPLPPEVCAERVAAPRIRAQAERQREMLAALSDFLRRGNGSG